MNFISWPQYFYFLLIVTTLYYLFIWIFYFRFALPSLKRVDKIFSRPRSEDAPDEIMSAAQHVIDELRPLFIDGIGRDELFAALQSKLKKYNTWSDVDFRAIINQFIINESQIKCSIRPGEKELGGLWLG
jgi:hypothetical protein